MKLRDYQEEGLQALWQYFMTNSGNPVLAWPTGTGKSLVPAEFIRRTMVNYPGQRFLMVTHVKELIEQNFDKLMTIWPNAPAGINSAGVGQRDFVQPIIYGGIQSMYKLGSAFGHRDLCFVDEAHLISQDDTSMYHKFLNELKKINPYLKIIGMSATPFRMGQGLITDGGLFTDIAHDLTSFENFNRMVEEGYLAPLVPKRTEVQLDVSNVGMSRGEFIASQLQHEVDKADITWKGLQELCYHGQNRRSWLLFATGIEHAEHISEMLNQLGIECAAVHSKQEKVYNDNAIGAFKNYKLRAIVNYGKLTTGFDHPGIDLIGMFRPTISTALWVQMLGRGTRPIYADGSDLDTRDGRLSAIANGPKQNCLVLDFAVNTMRLGPINDPVIPRKKGDKTGVVPAKLCEACGTYHHIKAIKCTECGHPFEFKVKIVEKASTVELIKGFEAPIIETHEVAYVFYARKQKDGKAPYIQVTYACGMKTFIEFVFPENFRYRKPFVDWWHVRHASDPPKNTDEALKYVSELRSPKRIRVHMNKMVNGRNYPEVLGSEY